MYFQSYFVRDTKVCSKLLWNADILVMMLLHNNNNNNNFHKQNYKFQYTVLKLHKSFRLLLQPCSSNFVYEN